MGTKQAVDEIKNRRWVERKLRSLRIVQWDRFTVGEWNGEQSISVYGWVDRDDEYKDFVAVILWPEGEGVYSLTSSAQHSEYITEQLHGEPGGHNDCQRIEDIFNVSNAVKLGQSESDQCD